MMREIQLNINGKDYSVQAEDREVLTDVIRDKCRLTGTHVGCDTSGCGACTIHVDGKAVKSCTMLAVQAEGKSLTTIEGMSQHGKLHPLQEGFKEKHGLQCGFCTPGMIMTAADLLKQNAQPSEHEIRAALEGNFCRCTGYHNIIAAIQYAADKL